MQESTAVSTRSVPTATGYVTIHFAPGGTKRPLAGSEEEQEDMSPSLDPKSGGHARCAQPHLLDNEYSQTTNNSAAVAAPAQSAPKRIRPSREGVRRGKWTAEEQAYADRLIRNFENGLLPLENGATLRAYLSKKLNCDPMRISKKFAGARCLGKQIFLKRGDESVVEHMSKEEEELLKQLEAEFLRSISNSSGSSSRRRNRATKEASSTSSSNPAPSAASQRYIAKSASTASDGGETDISSDTDSDMSNSPYPPSSVHHQQQHHYHGVAYDHHDASDHRLTLTRMKYNTDSSSSSSSDTDDMKSSGDESDTNDNDGFGHGISYSRLGIGDATTSGTMSAASSSMLVIEDIREAMNSLSAEGVEDHLPFHLNSPQCVSSMKPSTSSSCLVSFGNHHAAGCDDYGFLPVDFIEPLGDFMPDECFITDE